MTQDKSRRLFGVVRGTFDNHTTGIVLIIIISTIFGISTNCILCASNSQCIVRV